MQTNSGDIPTLAQDNEHSSLAERRPRRTNRMLPKRYRDILPQPAPSLPPSNSVPFAPVSSQASRPLESEIAQPAAERSSPRCHTHKELRTPKNIFGLVRKYFTEKLADHDPDGLITLDDLTSTHIATDQPRDRPSFAPYPNESSFLLGQWYWSGGVQKSQQSFKELLDIIGHPDFDPSDVRHAQWNKINGMLASNEAEQVEQQEWEDVDAGWRKKCIKISVPFHRRTESPGSREYAGAELYYRSLVDVIKEKVNDSHNVAQFHFEPYELLWKPTNRHKEVNVHGELYTSKVFLDAHHKLQKSPGEPNCDLPRVVVGLMLSSDSTHLTSFGNSKLWPCYLFIGNESKYRRCKPSYNLCSHVAYFQNVSRLIIHRISP